MMLRHDLRTDAHICGKFATLSVHRGRGVNRVYSTAFLVRTLPEGQCVKRDVMEANINTRLHTSAAILNILIRSSKSRATERQCPC